jgi:hypothetical protein
LGRPPFEGHTPEAILAKQTTDALPAMHTERADVSREAEEVLRRAVSSDAGQRYQSAAAFREGLDSATGGVLKRVLALLR